MLPFVALGYFAAGFVASGLVFGSVLTWTWRFCFEMSHENFARLLEKRGEIERAMHVRASLALFKGRWQDEENDHDGKNA